MPLQLISPIYDVFILEAADKKYGNTGDPTTVTIKQAREHEHLIRQRLYAKLERKWSSEDNPDEVRLIQEVSQADVWREEAYLTLVESNILDPEGNLLFKSKKGKNDDHPHLAMDKQAFYQAWGMLFPDIALEITEKIHEVNPQWAGPLGEAG